jgi:hypothetical protein
MLPAKKGLNRFVWDLRHPTLPGAPEVYIEGSFRGHKAIPGEYSFVLSFGDTRLTTKAAIRNNPLIPTTAEEFADYDGFMEQAEATYTEMTVLTNQMHALHGRLKALESNLEASGKTELQEQARELSKAMDAWDKTMVQRLSKAYDDVENFVNGFTAEYLTALNHADSAIPRVNQGTKQKIAELNGVWARHKATARDILDKQVAALNQALQQAGIGVLYLPASGR